jgi:hypothetical protein
MSMRLVLDKPPNRQTAQHNIESWSVIAAIMAAYGGASIGDLAAAVSQHRHRDGGRAFVEYCISRGWLKEAAT